MKCGPQFDNLHRHCNKSIILPHSVRNREIRNMPRKCWNHESVIWNSCHRIERAKENKNIYLCIIFWRFLLLPALLCYLLVSSIWLFSPQLASDVLYHQAAIHCYIPSTNRPNTIPPTYLQASSRVVLVRGNYALQFHLSTLIES